MCLYPKLILNKKYLPTKKNNYKPPQLIDTRLKYVPVGCGQCIECRKQKARQWQVRLHEELKSQKEKPHFVTLSFSEEALDKLCDELKCKESNAVAAVAVRRFCERWRKHYKVSIRHWLISELGHNNTERLHLHGLIWTNKEVAEIEKIWSYGNIWCGEYCNAKTINYIIKYVTKVDTMHKGFHGNILCSAGIGGKYTKSPHAQENKYKPNATREYYLLDSGSKVNLPIYYRNAIYTEEEREKLWQERLDKGERYIMGIRHDIRTESGYNEYYRHLLAAQRDNIKLGYGDDSNEWSWKDYNVRVKDVNKRLKVLEQHNSARVEQENTQKNEEISQNICK